MMRPKKILITGGAGYIGSVLSEKILQQYNELVIFDNFHITDDGISNIRSNPNLKIINGDIKDLESWKRAVDGIDTVIHLAGVSDGKSGKRDPELTIRINQGTFPYLVEEAKKAGVSRFVLASTFGVYGNGYQEPLSESLNTNPIDPYSKSKVFGENILNENTSDLFITTILRIAMVYGVSPRMRFDFIVNQMAIKALTEQKLTILGGHQRRPQIHIQDITDVMMQMLILDKSLISGETFNVGGQNPSIIEIAELIRKYLENTQLVVLSERENEDSFELDSSKIHDQLGIVPKLTIEDGILGIISSYVSGIWRDVKENKYYN